METTKTKHLTYIEETRKWHDKINDIAKEASEDAVAASLEEEVEITYLDGDKIIKESPNGQKKTVDVLENQQSREVEIGETTTLS